MTHKTGPREPVVDALAQDLGAAAVRQGATISETILAMFRWQRAALETVQRRQIKKLAEQQDAYMVHIREMLAPFEDELCPTCAKPGKLYDDFDKILAEFGI